MFAYIDPGTGSYLFQLVICFLVGSLFFLKQAWGRLVDFIRRNFRLRKPDGPVSH